MAKEQKGTETPETPKEEAQPEQETPEYSKETMDALRVEFEADKKAALDTQYAQLNTELSRKGQEIANLKRQPQSTSNVNALEAVLAAVDAGQGEYGDNPKIQAAKVIIAQEKQKEVLAQAEATRVSQYSEWVSFADSEKTKMEQKIRDADEDPGSEKFDRVWDACLIGKTSSGQEGFDLANSRLDRIIKQANPKEEKQEKVKDEDVRAYMEKKGLLKTETGTPSGTGGKKTYKSSDLAATEKQIASLPYEERREARKDLKDAFGEGRVLD